MCLQLKYDKTKTFIFGGGGGRNDCTGSEISCETTYLAAVLSYLRAPAGIGAVQHRCNGSSMSAAPASVQICGVNSVEQENTKWMFIYVHCHR
jgi:hypothetical protein